MKGEIRILNAAQREVAFTGREEFINSFHKHVIEQSRWVGHCSNCFTCINSFSLPRGPKSAVLFCPGGSGDPEVSELAPGHTASKWQSGESSRC